LDKSKIVINYITAPYRFVKKIMSKSGETYFSIGIFAGFLRKRQAGLLRPASSQ